PRKDGYPIMASFVSIYFRDFRVVQIEVSGARFKTTDGLSVKNTATQWEKHFPKFEQSFHKFAHQSADGVPATKIFENYEDDVATGIAWYYGGMGDLAPDPDPDGSVTAVVVHKPGEPVIIDPDGGGRYIYKERPNRLSTDR
ncbi:MAG TPA: hypothetical protein VG733_16400, partial [Chthoniobacteraceae bacterium]|nr:hypothetical protein [Chthoniobacteraceae bacterium]